MTLNTIIADLKKSGVNSKQKVISKLENLDLKELQELKRDVQEKINKEKENAKWLAKKNYRFEGKVHEMRDTLNLLQEIMKREKNNKGDQD